MKKTTFLILSLLLSIISFAQKDEDIQTSVDWVTTKAKIPAVKELNKDTKYFVVLPSKLSYFTSQFQIMSIENLFFKIPAKRARKQEDADYVFKVSTSGIKVTPTNTVYFDESVKGYLVKLNYTFLIDIEIINKQGVVEKTLRFNSEPSSWIYHMNFLLDPTTTEDWKPKKKIVPFPSVEKAQENLQRNESEIYKRMEYNTWYYTIEFANRAIEAYYNQTEITARNFYYNGFSNKKGKAQYSELSSFIDIQKNLIKELDDEKKYIETVTKIRENAAQFNKALDQIGSYSYNVKKIIYTNAALGALFANQLDKAAEYFLKYSKMNNTNDNDLNWSFRNTYKELRLKQTLSQNIPIINLDENIDFLYAK